MYTALSPKTGEDFSLLAPFVNTDCFNIFLQEMSVWLGERKAIIIVDQAGWHKSKGLCIPNNVSLYYLPAYSPELNPVERFWQHIKDNVLKNEIYESLEHLESSLSSFLKTIMPSDIISICNVNYMPYYL